ncbi:MAG: PEP-CTERM sorting domain-containing protein [Pirellulales bacterium]|nr:PEP-CTERM sorting domain-containing protein [Pirellulales bacterium]
MRQLWAAGLAVLALGVCMATQAQAAIDGILDDWGVTITESGNLVYDPAYGASYSTAQSPITPQVGVNVSVNGREVTYQIEDTNDGSNDYRVGPLWGGQNYDGEALFVSIDQGDLYIAIATGQRPDNAGSGDDAKYFAPGDISIARSDTLVWGIEVGGGRGGQDIANSVITASDPGTTYIIDANGFAIPALSPDVGHPADRTAGSLWETDGSSSHALDPGQAWQTGIAGSSMPRPRTQLTGGRLVEASVVPGRVEYAYNFGFDPLGLADDFGQHAFVELCIRDYADLDMFGDDLAGATILWAPVCGNDLLSVEVHLPKGEVPEPASLAIWCLLGIAGVAIGRCRRRKSA